MVCSQTEKNDPKKKNFKMEERKKPGSREDSMRKRLCILVHEGKG